MLAFVLILASSCTRVTPHGVWFFDGSTAVVYGRWNGASMFVTERVIRGDAKVHQTFWAPTGPCSYPRAGELYLVSYNCRDETCGVAWAEEEHAPRLLHYLRNRHFETHESVLAKALRWHEGKMSAEELDDWLATVAPRRRSKADDAFVAELVDELRWLIEELRPVPRSFMRAELDTIAKLARAFPRGTADAFDARIDAAGDQEAEYRDWYEEELLEAVKNARFCAQDLDQSP